MEFDENDNPAEEQDYDIEIYSKQSIFWFTVIFSPVFGGVMLMYNLRIAGYKRESLGVMIFSVAYYFIENYLFALLRFPFSMTNLTQMAANLAINIVFNVIAALVLTQYFFKKYFPENDYYPKSITTPIMVAFGLIILNMVLAKLYMPQLLPK